MVYESRVHGQRLMSLEPLGLPALPGDTYSQTCVVYRDESLVREASADRQPDSHQDRATDREAGSDDRIFEPEGWWGVRLAGDGSPRAGLTYNGYLVDIEIASNKGAPVLSDEMNQRMDVPGGVDARIRFFSDPEVPFEFPLGNMLERMIVPLWLMLTHDNISSIHAGAAIDADEQVGWVWTGPSGAGKSSILAAVLEKSTLRPCADETAVLQAESTNGAVRMLPGAPWLRLYEPPGVPNIRRERHHTEGTGSSPSFEASGELPDPVEKRWYRFHDDVYPSRAVPLQQWFLLDPDAAVTSPSIERLEGSDAATSLLSETIDFNQRDEAWATRRFQNAMEIARRVPASVIRYDNQRQTASEIAEFLLDQLGRQT